MAPVIPGFKPCGLGIRAPGGVLKNRMFTPVGRRLALLNALVVVAVIAITGVLILVLLQRALSREEERSLRDRVRGRRNLVVACDCRGSADSDRVL